MPSPETLPLFELARSKGIGFYLGYRRADGGGGQDPALQHLDPGRAGRTYHRQVPQGPSAGPRRAPAGRALSASREEVLRGRRPGLQRLEDVQGRHHRRPVHLQRPALARDVPRHGAEGRRDGGAGLQHADRQRLCAQGAALPARVPPQPLDPGRRLPERHLGRGHRQGGQGGRLLAARRHGHRGADRRDRRQVEHRGGRGRLLRLRHGARRIHPQHDLQFRQAPPARTLQADRRAHRR